MRSSGDTARCTAPRRIRRRHPCRAIAYIWLGDDAFYDAAPGRTDPDFRDGTIPDGAPLVSERFPLVRGTTE